MPGNMLFNLVKEGRQSRRAILLMCSHNNEQRAIHMDTVNRLHLCFKRHREPSSASVTSREAGAVSARAKIEITTLIRDYQPTDGAGDQPNPSPELLQNREAFVKALET